jgi:hypothetical protein
VSYEGKHRREDDGLPGGSRVKKVAGLTGLAATAAAVATVGMGGGTASADGGLLHNLFSPKPSGSSSPNVNANLTKPTSVFGSGFGQIITKPAQTTITSKATPVPNNLGQYFGFNKNGWAITGICVNPSGC